MGLFDMLKETFSMSPEWVGKRFEKLVIEKFDERYFDLVEQTHSFKTNQERFVESSLNPDYILRYRPTKEEFAVECKYRSGLDNRGMLNWSNPQQLRRYHEFAEKRKIPVYIVIGFKGLDDDPEDIFLIPLEEAKYPSLYPSQFNKYSRNPKKNFYWKDGELY
jgi:hypothetical protein